MSAKNELMSLFDSLKLCGEEAEIISFLHCSNQSSELDSVCRMSKSRLRSGVRPGGTIQLLQQLEVQLAQGQIGVLAAQATADQAHGQLARFQRGAHPA